MSGIPVIGKIFDAIKKNKILKAIVVAAIIYFTVSAAMEYFAASGASTAAAGGTITTTASATQAEMLAAQTSAFGAEGASLTADALASNAAMTGAESGIVSGVSGGTVPPPVTPEPSWFAKNPMATMMLGQGVAGAAGSHEEKKAQEAAIAQREKERKERGLFGFDYEGKPAGVVSSMMQQPDISVDEQQVQAAQAPVVASQQIPIQKKDLPKLNQQGQLAVG